MKYITNCPNCGAPLKGYGRCDYCGTVIDQPVQMLVARPGIHKLVCQARLPLYIGEKKPELATEYAMRQIRDQMADALTDAIKFVSRKDFDPIRFEEIITVRGELWVADPNVNY